MIYTVSVKAETDARLAEMTEKGERLFKTGVNSRTRGGPVWKTREEAATFVAEEKVRGTSQEVDLDALEVYGVEAEWDRDTLQYPDEPFARLIISRPMVKV